MPGLSAVGRMSEIMKKLILSITFIFLFAVCASAQQVTCEQSFVDDATKAFTEVVALRDEVKAKDKSIEDLKAEVVRLQIELAKSSTRATELEKQQVSDRAIIEFLLKHGRVKKYGLINLF